MAIANHEVRSALNDLIEICKDGEEGYKTGAEKLTEPDIRTLFLEYARQRVRFGGELQAEIVKLGGEQAAPRSGALQSGWSGLNSARRVEHDLAVLEEAERGEDSTLKVYHEVLERDLPAELRLIIERQYWQIRKVHDNVRALRYSHWRIEVPMAGLV